MDVRQRTRDARIGPDGLMYLDGALIVLKPLRPATPRPVDADNDYNEAQGTPPIVR